MEFGNPILGLETLIRTAIRSKNFLTGISGWRIAADGSAEFNNLTIRGQFNGTNFILNSAGAFFYNGTPATGNLIAAIAAVAGTDAFGNAYNGVFNVGNQQAAHFGVDSNGTVYFSNAANQTVIIINPNRGALLMYSGTPAAGNLISSVAYLAGTDSFGNVYPAGFMSTDGTNTSTMYNGISRYYQNSVPTDYGYIGTNGFGRVDITSSIDTLSGLTHALRMVMVSGGPLSTDQRPYLNLIDALGTRPINVGVAGIISHTSPSGSTDYYVTPNLNANWSQSTTFNGSTNWDPLTLRLGTDDKVHVFGCFKAAAGAASAVFQLPVGMRPLGAQEPITGLRNNGGVLTPFMVGVSTSGNFNMLAASGGSIVAGNEYLVNGFIPLWSPLV
jgi:hypothetical protein